MVRICLHGQEQTKNVCVCIRSGILYVKSFMVLLLQAWSGLLILLSSHSSSAFLCSHGLRLNTINCRTTFFLAAKYFARISAFGSFQAVFGNAISSLFVASFQCSYWSPDDDRLVRHNLRLIV